MDELTDSERQVLRSLGIDPDDTPAQHVEFEVRHLPSALEVAALLDADVAHVEPIVQNLQAGSAFERAAWLWLEDQRGRADWDRLADEAATLGLPP